MILVNVIMAKPGENDLFFIAAKFDPGHWEFGIKYTHFLVAMHS